jgi:hypothetical protein
LGGKSTNWVDGSTKFLSLELKKDYKTDLVKGDWRPWLSEQSIEREIIFTVDDNSIASEIKGEHSLLFLDWQDEVSGLQSHEALHARINNYREERFNAILKKNERL